MPTQKETPERNPTRQTPGASSPRIDIEEGHSRPAWAVIFFGSALDSRFLLMAIAQQTHKTKLALQNHVVTLNATRWLLKLLCSEVVCGFAWGGGGRVGEGFKMPSVAFRKYAGGLLLLNWRQKGQICGSTSERAGIGCGPRPR